MFDSFNLYKNLAVIGSRTPEELVKKVTAITTPIKIINIIGANNRFYCYFISDLKVQVNKDLPKAKKVND